MNKFYVDEEKMCGTPTQLKNYIKKEVKYQMTHLEDIGIEMVSFNLKMSAEILDIINENSDKKLLTLLYNPMGSWFLKEETERVCSECGKAMKKGYVIEDGMEYYCSNKCLHANISQKNYLELYDDGNGNSYWTEWED